MQNLRQTSRSSVFGTLAISARVSRNRREAVARESPPVPDETGERGKEMKLTRRGENVAATGFTLLILAVMGFAGWVEALP